LTGFSFALLPILFNIFSQKIIEKNVKGGLKMQNFYKKDKNINVALKYFYERQCEAF